MGRVNARQQSVEYCSFGVEQITHLQLLQWIVNSSWVMAVLRSLFGPSQWQPCSGLCLGSKSMTMLSKGRRFLEYNNLLGRGWKLHILSKHGSPHIMSEWRNAPRCLVTATGCRTRGRTEVWPAGVAGREPMLGAPRLLLSFQYQGQSDFMLRDPWTLDHDHMREV